jgi:hypothetical protein
VGGYKQIQYATSSFSLPLKDTEQTSTVSEFKMAARIFKQMNSNEWDGFSIKVRILIGVTLLGNNNSDLFSS